MLSKPIIKPILQNFMHLQKHQSFQKINNIQKYYFCAQQPKNSEKYQNNQEILRKNYEKSLQQNNSSDISNKSKDLQQQEKEKKINDDSVHPLQHMEGKYVYDKEKFEKVNTPAFVEKIKKMEDEKMNDNTWAFDGIRFPLVLVIGSLIIYHTWETIPFGVAYRHFSHSEYIPREKHYHAIFLGNLSFQNTGQLIVYFPLMVGSLILTAKYFKQRHMFYLFASNSLLTYGITYAYERSKKYSPMITPKSHGSATALAFLSAQLALNPTFYVFGTRLLPFFIIPATMYMYEIWEFQNGYINEVCRPAHFGSIIYGFLFGLVFKKFFFVQPRKII